jgi:hypothetical protein
MIGAPTQNPREGDRRQKALAQAVAARMRGGMSRFSKTGVGRGPRTGVGTRPTAPGGGRPSGVLNFLSQKGPQGFGPNGAAFVGMPSNLGGGAPPAAPPSPLGGSIMPQGPDVPLSEGGSYFDPTAPIGSPTGQTPGDAVEGNFENIWGFNSAPATPITVGGGLIPLGGGVFLDPETGAIHGGGL